MPEPKQVEYAWLRSRLWTTSLAPRLRPPKRHQPGFLQMERQTVHPKPLRQDFHDLAGVLFTSKTHDEVIRITDQEGLTSQVTLHPILEPDIQHIVQIDVGQEW